MSETIADPGKAVRLQELRSQLQALERGAGGARPPFALGLAGLDAHLGGGLPRGCLHEVAGAVDDGAAAGFCAALLGRLSAEPMAGPVLWCQPTLDLYGPGLAAFGLDPARLIVVTARRPADRLWAMEEGLRCPALAAVLGELDALDLTAARRLQLAAETSGVTGFVLHPNGGHPAQATAVTRWKITAAAAPVSAGHGVHRSDSMQTHVGAAPCGRPLPEPVAREQGAHAGAPLRNGANAVFPAGHGVHRSFSDGGAKWLGPARWQVELLRCRGGRPGRWLIEWTEGGWRDATGDVAVAAALRDRPDSRTAHA